MQLDWTQLEQMFYQFFWPFVRISTLLFAMSVFGANLIPTRIRIFLAISITLLIAPTLAPIAKMEILSGDGFIAMISQIGIGAAMGLATRVLFETFVIGGQMIAMQTGLGFASLVDPINGVQVPVLGQFFLMLTTLIFLAVDGHLLLLRIVAESFVSFPVSSAGPEAAGMWSLIMFGRWMFAGAVLMALSAALALLTVNLTFGIMTKAAPQLNIFAIGFPISMIAGLLLLWLTLSGFTGHFDSQMSKTTEIVCRLVKLEC